MNVFKVDGKNRGLRRSWGHLSMSEEDINRCIQLLRAFVRPVHGEIWIVKKDGHPSHRSETVISNLIDATILNQTSPPYVHEGVGLIENTLQWDIPSANALLTGSNSGEEDLYTALLDVERSGNRKVDLDDDGRSREAIYKGYAVDLLASHLIYGSPVKYLIHPEVRDSKFEEHASSGTYRGASREDESEHRCWIKVGFGATARHITADMGCIRIDERGVIARCDMNHPSHQPHAIDAPPAAPAPDFSRWLHPAYESYAVLDVWTASTPLPERPTLLVIGGGELRDGDSKYWATKLTSGAVSTIVIDQKVGGHEHDWRIPSVKKALCELAQSDSVFAIIWGWSCGGWSALHYIQPGPPVLFDVDNLAGIPLADGSIPLTTQAVLSEIDSGLEILNAGAGASTPKIFLGEAPVGRGRGSPFAFKDPKYAKHVNAFTYPPMAQFLERVGAVSVYSDQSPAGAATSKTTEYMVTPSILAAARTNLGTLRDGTFRVNSEADSLIGSTTGDFGKGSKAEVYTSRLWQLLILVVLSATAYLSPAQQVPRGSRQAVRNDGSSAGLPLADTLSLNRPRRHTSSVAYSAEGRVVASLSRDPMLLPPSDVECMMEDVAVMVLHERHARAELMMGNVPKQRNDLDTAVELVDMTFFAYDTFRIECIRQPVL
jgi:hypothetical protein